MADSEMYAYAVGRVRAMENRLFGKVLLERMIEARSPEDVISMLADNGYPQTGGVSVREYISMLEDIETAAIKEVAGFSPEPKLFDIFPLKYDYHNAKVAVKALAAGCDPSGVYSENGLLSQKRFIRLFNDKAYSDMPYSLGKAIKLALDCILEIRSPQNAELILDKAYIDDCYDIASSARNSSTRDFLKRYVEVQADFTDIEIIFRLRRHAENRVSVKEAYLPGSLDMDFILHALDTDNDKLEGYFRATPYAKQIQEAMSKSSKVNTITYIEKMSDDYITAFIREKRTNTFGIEALFAYITGRQREIMNIRIILQSKLSELQTETLRERLRVLL